MTADRLRIGMISGHACIRVQKMALPLLERGHEVHLIAQKRPSFFERYDTFSFTAGMRQYREAIKLYADKVDVFHAHNEPSWFVTLIKEHCDTPVVLDVHDSWAARITEEEEVTLRDKGKDVYRIISEERNNFQLADALNFPSESFADIVKQTYGLGQPSLITPSYVPRQFYRYNTAGWMGGLVYEGRVDLKQELDDDPNRYGFRYCDYEDLARKTQELGMDFHIYTTRNDDKFNKVYDDICFRHEPRDFDRLLKSLTRHDWGLVGNIDPTPEWEVAFPNKLFEYTAACVPIVAINAKACGEFIRKHKIGIEVESLEELGKRWKEHTECRKNLIRKRQEFAMETHIPKLEELYRSLL